MIKQMIYSLLIVVVILLTGCGQATDQSSEWKTFTNDQYSYSFEVPASCYEGPLLGECKQKPPEERAPECLCFVNGQDPDNVMFQYFTGEIEMLSLAGINISSPDSPAFRPPLGADLIQFVKQEFGEAYREIPDAPNMDLGGVPAVRISIAGSPMAPDYDEIYFLHADQLFQINLLEPADEYNSEIYDHFLESFEFGD